jgi:hypothetical protein
MINDKLTRGERIRLESLNQVLNWLGPMMVQRPPLMHILENAEQVEKWIKAARDDG